MNSASLRGSHVRKPVRPTSRGNAMEDDVLFVSRAQRRGRRVGDGIPNTVYADDALPADGDSPTVVNDDIPLIVVADYASLNVAADDASPNAAADDASPNAAAYDASPNKDDASPNENDASPNAAADDASPNADDVADDASPNADDVADDASPTVADAPNVPRVKLTSRIRIGSIMRESRQRVSRPHPKRVQHAPSRKRTRDDVYAVAAVVSHQPWDGWLGPVSSQFRTKSAHSNVLYKFEVEYRGARVFPNEFERYGYVLSDPVGRRYLHRHGLLKPADAKRYRDEFKETVTPDVIDLAD